MLTRRQFVLGLGGGLATLGGGGAYPRWVEPRWLKVSRTTVTLGNAAAGTTPVRVLHLSDFHLSDVVSLAFIAESVELGLAQKPDVIALTGDFVTNRVTHAVEYSKVLARLSSAAPTFACLGNHDGGLWTRRVGGSATIDAVLSVLASAGITCLTNAARSAVVRGKMIQLIGVGDLWSGMCNPAKAFAQTPERNGALRVVLNHNPDAKELFRRFDWDLMLCGHTHGGQVRLPFIGTPFLPVRDKRFVSGLYRWDNRPLYITRGVGNLHGIRFNCRPEVSVLELV